MKQSISITQIAKELITLCREGKWEEAQKRFYHTDVISTEPAETGGHVTKGLEALLKKNEMWASMTKEVHGWSISDPIIADGYFACTMSMDVTLNEGGRMQSTELCIYKVLDGKIVSEQFFHD